MSAPPAEASAPARAGGLFQLQPAGDGRFAARGPLTFATAREARTLGLSCLTAAPAGGLEIDGSGISASDSAGLAVLLDWLAAARRAGRSLRYTRLPEGLLALGRISEIEALLERGV